MPCAFCGGGVHLLGVAGQGLDLDLTEAEVGSLTDDAASWGQVGQLHLHGFRYRSIDSEMTTGERLAWLEKAVPFSDKGEFDPHPFTQLAGVFRAQGHRRAAARILYRRERRLAKAEFQAEIIKFRTGKGGWGTAFRACFFRSVAAPFRWFFGYGHHPARALVWVFGICVLTAGVAGAIYNAGQMAPNSPVILTSPDWVQAVHQGCPLPGDMSNDDKRRRPGCVPPLVLWAGKGDIPAMASAKDYETFSAGLYALDLFAPVVELGQVQAWAPSRDRGWWGWSGFYTRWFVEGMGWFIVVVGAAVLTGLVGKRDD